MSTSESARGLSRRQLFTTAGKAGLLIASVGGIGGLLDACSSAASTGGQAAAAAAAAGAPVKGGTLIAAITGNPSSLDPAIADIYTGTEVYDNIFSKLVEMQPNGTIGPALATKWTHGHADVVPAEPLRWRPGLNPWAVTVEGDRWYGRGIADNKGQHTINLAALRADLRDRSYHSGNWGGLLRNPATVLAGALASLVNGRGEILVPGLRPPPIPDNVRAALRTIRSAATPATRTSRRGGANPASPRPSG